MVRIDRECDLLAGRDRTHDVGVALDRVEIGGLRNEVRLAQQARMPIGRPALVHDLRGKHRIEVKGLLAHRKKNVALPALHLRSICSDEPEQVALRMRRQRRAYFARLRHRFGSNIERRKAGAKRIVRRRRRIG